MTTFASAPRNQAPPAAIRPAPREVARAAARKWLLPAVIAAGALPVLAVWWQGVTPMSLHDAGGSLTTAGRATGLLGAYLMLVLTALMARIPFVENRIGSDAAARDHRESARAGGDECVVLGSVHIYRAEIERGVRRQFGRHRHRIALARCVRVAFGHKVLAHGGVGREVYVERVQRARNNSAADRDEVSL